MDSSLPVKSPRWVFSQAFWSKFKSLLPIVGLAATLPILVAGVQTSKLFLSKAAPSPTHVPIPPGFGSAIKFNNTNSNDTYISTPPYLYFSSVPFTVETWIYIAQDNLPKQGEIELINYSKTKTAFDFGYTWRLNLIKPNETETLWPRFQTLLKDSQCCFDVVGKDSSIKLNTWNHLAAVYYSNAGTCSEEIYLNGFLVGKNTTTHASCLLSSDNPKELLIGKHPVNTPPFSYNFSGILDDTRISGIRRYTQNFTPPPYPFTPDQNTQLLYGFDGQTQDSSGHNNHGIVSGTNYEFVSSTIATPTPTPTPTPTTSPDPKLNCTKTGGTWREFPDSCADICPSNFPEACSPVLTLSCDCGPVACWSGTYCIPNPSIPTPTPSPTATPTPTPLLPDLVVTKITNVDPNITPDQANQFYQATVCNQGKSDVGKPFTTKLYNQLDPSKFFLYSSGTWPVEPGFCFTFAEKCTIFGAKSCQDKITLTAAADFGQEVPESNETNNLLTVSFNPNTPPAITTRLLLPGRIGLPYKATITGQDADPGQALTMTITNLPPGITQNKCSTTSTSSKNNQIRCDISGRPGKIGTWPVRVVLRDDQGASVTKILKLTITKKYWLF